MLSAVVDLIVLKQQKILLQKLKGDPSQERQESILAPLQRQCLDRSSRGWE